MLLNVTIADNQVDQAGGGGSGGNGGGSAGGGAPGVGAGVYDAGNSVSDHSPATSLQNTLLASNAGGNCGGNKLADGGHNLSFGDTTCVGNYASGDPKLGPLQSNGGPTQTMALQAGSAAIDQVPASGASCPATDQRGVSRRSLPAGAATSGPTNTRRRAARRSPPTPRRTRL